VFCRLFVWLLVRELAVCWCVSRWPRRLQRFFFLHRRSLSPSHPASSHPLILAMFTRATQTIAKGARGLKTSAVRMSDDVSTAGERANERHRQAARRPFARDDDPDWCICIRERCCMCGWLLRIVIRTDSPCSSLSGRPDFRPQPIPVVHPAHHISLRPVVSVRPSPPLPLVQGHAHKTLNPPYNRKLTTGLLLATTVGSFYAIWSSVTFQQRKGGYWYKTEKK
jgi:hypothetical protein